MSFLKRRPLLLAASVCLSGLLAIGFFHAFFLRSAAHLWVIDEPLAPADAIVVLGGGLQNRPFVAADLLHAGRAPRILLMDVKPSPTTEMGLTLPEHELTRKVLLAQGADPASLLTIGSHVASSRDEAMAVADWLASTGARRIIIPTDPFHTRRVEWLYEKTLRGKGIDIIVTTAPRREYTPDNWWHTEEGLIDFQNEIIKYFYYRLKY